MSIPRRSLFEAILARISLGSIPVDGSYWFDPKGQGGPQSPGKARVPEADWSPVGVRLSRRRAA